MVQRDQQPAAPQSEEVYLLPEPIATATGRRKSATANVQLYPGSGSITVNGSPVLDYLKRETLVMIVEEPLKV